MNRDSRTGTVVPIRKTTIVTDVTNGIDTPGMTSGNPLIDEWEVWQYAARLSDVTVSERVRVLRIFETEAGINPADATPLHIVRWYSSHADDWSRSTHCTYHSYLAAWFKWLQLQEYRVDSPMVKVGSPKQPDRVPRAVADSEPMRLLSSNMHHRTRVMILLGALQGLRVHEIAKFRGEDIDHEREIVTVHGKGGKVKPLPLHRIIAATSRTMPARGWWFPANATRPGEHIHSKSVSQIIGKAMRRAGIQRTAHGLRHWYGTTLLDDGADLRVVQELLRHASLSTTQIYTKVPDGRRRTAVEALDPWRAIA